MTYDVQAIEITGAFDRVFEYIADPRRLPEWTHAFKAADAGQATLATPGGTVDIGLAVRASRVDGTIDWTLAFPDGSEARAYSRLVRDGQRCIYTFVLLPPPVPLEQVEGALADQSRILREELVALRARLEASGR